MVLGIRGRGPGAERGEGFCGGESEDGKKALAWHSPILYSEKGTTKLPMNSDSGVF